MPEFTANEINLICLYEGTNRLNTIREINHMMRYLLPDERELRELAQSAVAKLKKISDQEYAAFLRINFS